MGRNSYLGGNTIETARTNPYRLENSRPEYIHEESDRPASMLPVAVLDADLAAEMELWDFDTLEVWLSGFDHAFRHGDLTVIPKLEQGDVEYENYLMRIANRLMDGRTFHRSKGEIVIQKDGKLAWNRNEFCQFVEGCSRAARAIDACMPELSEELRDFLSAS